MRNKIFFLGQDSSFCVGFIKALRQRGYELVGLTEYSDHEDLFEDVGLIIYSPDKTQQLGQICHNVLNRYSKIPAIFILPNDHSFSNEIEFNATRKVIRPLTRIDGFLKEVDDLLALTQLYNGESSKNLAGVLKEFSSFELESVIQKTLEIFYKKVDCENVYWLRVEEFQRLSGKRKAVDRLKLSEVIEKPTYMKSHIPCLEQEVIQLLGGFNNNLLDLSSAQVCHDENQKKNLFVPIVDPLENQTLAFLVFRDLKSEELSTVIDTINDEVLELQLLLSFSFKFQKAVNTSFMDDLTDLFNHRYLRMMLDAEIERCKRSDSKFTVLFIDVDYFKAVNDNRGHLTGSKILAALGDTIRDTVRGSDYSFRYGGDEYVVILTAADCENAQVVAERIRKTIEDRTYEIDGHEHKLTVSIGLATYPDHAQTREDVVRMADKAMYYGKNKSRNIVYIAS